MTTEDRAYEAAARVLLAGVLEGVDFDELPSDIRMAITDNAKHIVTTFLKAMGQEVR